MNKNLKSLVVPIALLGVLALPTLVHADDDRTINERQQRQQQRIREGAREGELTRQESAELKARAARIREEEARARRSGNGLSDAEKRRLQDRLDDLNDDINRQKDDDQERRNSRYRGNNNRGNNGYYRPGNGNGYYRPGNGNGYGSYRPGINDRQRWQQNQIGRGRRTGVLTPAEAATLRAREARVRVLEARLRNSGNRLSASERYRLQRELDQLRRDIYRQSTDRQYGR